MLSLESAISQHRDGFTPTLLAAEEKALLDEVIRLRDEVVALRNEVRRLNAAAAPVGGGGAQSIRVVWNEEEEA